MWAHWGQLSARVGQQSTAIAPTGGTLRRRAPTADLSALGAKDKGVRPLSGRAWCFFSQAKKWWWQRLWNYTTATTSDLWNIIARRK